MGYVNENLLPDETVIYQAHIHWIIYVWGVAIVLASLFFYQFSPLALAVFGLGVVMLVKAYIFATTTEFVVTNQRIIAKMGWVSRTAVEVRHEKVEGLSLIQGVWGRMFNYGTLILSGTGTGRTLIPNIDNPLEFRKHALAAMEADERDNAPQYNR